MKHFYPRLVVLLAALGMVAVGTSTPSSARAVAETGQDPSLTSVGPLAFAPDGTLFAADNLEAAPIYRARPRRQASGGGARAPRASTPRSEAGRDARHRRRPRSRSPTSPCTRRSRNSFVAVMRGQGAGAAARRSSASTAPARSISVSLRGAEVPEASTLPNAPAASTPAAATRAPSSVTDMALVNGRLWVAGLSNEEFASKLCADPVSVRTADSGTSVEIYHGNHGALETRSPVYAFVPYTIDRPAEHHRRLHLHAAREVPGVGARSPARRCAARRSPSSAPATGRSTWSLYKKDGKEFLLMSNTSRGVMKIPTDDVRARAAPITAPVTAKPAACRSRRSRR